MAQIVGMFAAISALYVNPTYYFRVPTWLNEVTDHTQDAYHSGGDFSVFLGMGVAALVYLVLAYGKVARGGRRAGARCSGRSEPAAPA